MRITILIGAFLPCPPLQGGAVEKMWFELAKKFVEKGHEVRILSKKWEKLSDGIDEFGIEHIRIKGYKAPSSIGFRLIKDFFYTYNALSHINENTDIIITNTFWFPILAKKSLKAKIYVDVARVPKGQLKLYKGVARLRANSTPVEKAIIAEIGCSNGVVCIPNPLPFDLNNHHIEMGKQKVILFVGRLHPEKGVDLLINAFTKLKLSEWTLKIIGPHDIKDGGGGDLYYKSLIEKVNASNIELLGPIYDKEMLLEEYKKSSIFVYPSLAEKGETFGLAPLEAMACGSVPLLSDLECFKDFVIEGKNGIFFNHRPENKVKLLEEKLEYLINNHEIRSSLAHNAFYVNKSHSSNMVADMFLEDFNKIIMENKY